MKKALISMCLLVMLGCTASHTPDLTKAEVREYQGKRLDSIVDARDVSIKGPQNINLEQYKLEVNGLVENPKNYSYNEVVSHRAYIKEVELNCIEGWKADVLWQGILLKELFDEVKVKKDANTVIFKAADGYSTSLPLEYILNKDILLGYKINNVTLDPAHGFPFELVAEDKFGYKWIKWVTNIELSNNSSYEGYWESRSYDNNANLK